MEIKRSDELMSEWKNSNSLATFIDDKKAFGPFKWIVVYMKL